MYLWYLWLCYILPLYKPLPFFISFIFKTWAIQCFLLPLPSLIKKKKKTHKCWVRLQSLFKGSFLFEKEFEHQKHSVKSLYNQFLHQTSVHGLVTLGHVLCKLVASVASVLRYVLLFPQSPPLPVTYLLGCSTHCLCYLLPGSIWCCMLVVSIEALC